MPFKSQAQRKFMHAKHPKIADRWEGEYPVKKKLPEHVAKKTTARRPSMKALVD